jgi:hypothetical protein
MKVWMGFEVGHYVFVAKKKRESPKIMERSNLRHLTSDNEKSRFLASLEMTRGGRLKLQN